MADNEYPRGNCMTHVWPAYGHGHKPADVQERRRTIEAAAEAVFGNHLSAGVWLGRYAPTVRDGTATIESVAESGPEGLAEALAELERIKPSVIPTPLPVSLTKARSRRRR